jgi:hypothetical protein
MNDVTDKITKPITPIDMTRVNAFLLGILFLWSTFFFTGSGHHGLGVPPGVISLGWTQTKTLKLVSSAVAGVAAEAVVAVAVVQVESPVVEEEVVVEAEAVPHALAEEGEVGEHKPNHLPRGRDPRVLHPTVQCGFGARSAASCGQRSHPDRSSEWL